MSVGKKLNLAEYSKVVLDHRDGGAAGKIPAKVFGIVRLAVAVG